MSSALQNTFPQRDLLAPTHYRVADRNGVHRADLEDTVKVGFARHFGAEVHSFMPLLSAFSLPQSPKRVCVFGLRRASEKLFIESYLPFALTHYLNHWQCTAFEVFEMGNLVSTHPLATLNHFAVMADALKKAGGKCLVFCATDEVRKLLARIGIHCQVICEARAEAVAGSADNWGSYYDHQPKVCLVSLDQAAQLIASQPHLNRLLSDNQGAIDALLLEVSAL